MMTERIKLNIVLIFILLITTILSCKKENDADDSFIQGEINNITFDIVKKKEDYCNYTRAFIGLKIWSERDTIVYLKSLYNAGCDFERESGLVFKLNKIRLPTLAITEDTILSLKLMKNIPESINLTIQQGVYPKNILKNNLTVDELKNSLKERDWFIKLLNSDSLNYSEIVYPTFSEKINIKATENMKVEYILDDNKIEKRTFNSKEFEVIPPPDIEDVK
ncbi:MAG: hypothetical protein Q4G27_02860 [Flavobacteriaceae bacterium]|nr:hypothetical protein [Flavobacteriaceae bacterium]